MKRIEIEAFAELPPELEHFTRGAKLYDSSCSPEARVIFIDRGAGYYLKSAPKGTLQREALMARYFNSKGLSPAVLEYISRDVDWLLTERLDGEDATHPDYLCDPARLAAFMGATLRELHGLDFSDCPVSDRMKEYFDTVERNHARGAYDLSYCDLASADAAYSLAMSGRDSLTDRVLLHGDFCLPNFIMKDWRLSGFIDLGAAGVGDRHIDLFWGAWTLNFNLKTDKYRDIFFDAYGRELISPDALRVIGAAEAFG